MCASTNKLNVVSYNILSPNSIKYGGYDKLSDTVINWQYRKTKIVNAILDYSPDIICFQEVNSSTFNDLNVLLKQNGYSGVLSLNSQEFDSVAIFYKKDYIEINGYKVKNYLQENKVFLDAFFKKPFNFRVINTKFNWDNSNKPYSEHIGYNQADFLYNYISTNNIKTASTNNGVAELVGKTADSNILLCGDFNMNPSELKFTKLLNSFYDVYQPYNIYTFILNGERKRIDYILASNGLFAKPLLNSSGHINNNDKSDKHDQRIISDLNPSDHFPIGIEVWQLSKDDG